MKNTLSTYDNCIFVNCIEKDGYPYDRSEIEYLINFTTKGLQSVVENYYYRSERIIKRMRELDTDDDATWIDIDKVYVNPIFEILKSGDYAKAYTQTIKMLEGLETQYGVI